MTRSGLRRFDAYIFDLDGTIYVDDELIPGADETIAQLRADGARVAFVTNHPLHPAGDYAERLTRLGIPTDPAEIVTSVDALIRYLRQTHPGATVLPISEDEVRRRLTADGFAVTDDPRTADVVVVSFDRTFTYAKLLAGYRAVRERGAAIVATNPDPFCPTRDGGLPDCAAMLAALEACSGGRAEAVVGKPSRHMVAAVLERLDVAPEATAVVGDRPATDVAMGQSIGATGILVLSGATSAAEAAAADVRPDHTLDSIRDLIPTRDKDRSMIEFIFMLTHNDATVPNALEVLAEVQDAGLRYIGFKDVGQPPEVLTEIAERSHDAGLEVMLEVVSTSAEDELRSVRAALDIGVDWVLGGTNPGEAGAVLAGTDVRYCPFPGTIVGHPSVLEGAPEAIAAHAGELTARPGVHGVDLLAYRHPGTDPVALTRQVVQAASGPVIVAGSIVGADQIQAVADAGAWGFTIGGAIFEERLPGAPSVREQVARVLALDIVADGARTRG